MHLDFISKKLCEQFLTEQYMPKPGTVDLMIGLQYGDEGKGKDVDIYAPSYNIVARWQGGPNSGHTITVHGEKMVFHTLPSGAQHKKCELFIGNKVTVNPIILQKEICDLREQTGIDACERLFISESAILILPTHLWEDELSELALGDRKIGSTKNGITPAYTADIARRGLRMGDLLKDNYEEVIDDHISADIQRLNMQYSTGMGILKNHPLFTLDAINEWKKSLEIIQKQMIVSNMWILDQLEKGKTVLGEGAQATWLDLTFGDYNKVTSSNTISGSACVGLGIPPQKINRIYGIFKAYDTRVGEGPFTEFPKVLSEKIRKIGSEYGASTGRPRKTGPLNMQTLLRAIRLNGVTNLIMNKLDVLNNLEFYVIGEDGFKIPFRGTCVTKDGECNEWAEEFLSYITTEIDKRTDARLTGIGIGPDREDYILNRKTH